MRNRLHVMVVEDTPDIASMLQALLELLGHQVVLAHNPSAALKLAATIQPNVIMLDIGLPEMDGYDLGCQLRKIHPEVAFIGHSAWPRNRTREEESGFTFDHYLVKPLRLAQLNELLALQARAN